MSPQMERPDDNPGAGDEPVQNLTGVSETTVENLDGAGDEPVQN